MHIDLELVRRLIDAQFPHYRHLPLTPVAQSGWDNRTFRLGEHLSVRLPSAEAYVAQVHKEARWLPYLSARCAITLPTVVTVGEPAEGYPWPWSVRRWIPGQTLLEAQAHLSSSTDIARGVGEFLRRFAAIETLDGPLAGAQNHHRGGRLKVYDAQMQHALTLFEQTDVGAARIAHQHWATALVSDFGGPGVWVHGDMSADNLLIDQDRLSAVIDFGCLGVGDPACDLAIAWTFFDETARVAFKAAVDVDEQTWSRGRGWALWKALIVNVGLVDTKAQEKAGAPGTLARILAEA
ncbi:MAG: aminoglycoside phosphotransferase family protein [Pseudomonadota bacterium]